MFLTSKEKGMLNGKEGTMVQEAMEVLVKLGEAFEAKRMLDSDAAHIYSPGLIAQIYTDKEIDRLWEKTIKENVRVKCFTTCCASIPDLEVSKEIEGFSDDFRNRIKKAIDLYKKLGVVPTIACAPYLIGILPQRGQHLEVTESSWWVFVNSILGACANRGGFSAQYTAITGKTPEYGMHLKKNRRANKLVKVETEITSPADAAALFFLIGKFTDEVWDVPVIEGIQKPLSLEHLKQATGAISASGAAAMFHIVGITPEAPTLEAALQEHKPDEIIVIDEAELKRAYSILSTANTHNVDMIILGCPHASIEEIGEIARMLEGKKINPNIRLWIQCLPEQKLLADKCGYTQIIEQAGGYVLRYTCGVMFGHERKTQSSIPEQVNILATNSAKAAYYAPAQYDWGVWYGSTKQCIHAAISGRWEDNL